MIAFGFGVGLNKWGIYGELFNAHYIDITTKIKMCATPQYIAGYIRKLSVFSVPKKGYC